MENLQKDVEREWQQLLVLWARLTSSDYRRRSFEETVLPEEALARTEKFFRRGQEAFGATDPTVVAWRRQDLPPATLGAVSRPDFRGRTISGGLSEATYR